MKLLKEPIEYFTTNKEEGWIHVIKKHTKKKILAKADNNALCITPTGWVNSITYT